MTVSIEDMGLDALRGLAEQISNRIAGLERVEAARSAVVEAVAGYAAAAGVTVDEAWKALVPAGLFDSSEVTPVDADDWAQPTGAHDAYSTGDMVAWQGAVYRSRVDGNVWSPAAYPMGWEKV